MESDAIIVSMSGLATFLRCRKAYQIQYEWMREPNKSNSAVKLGSSFHKIMEEVANSGWILPSPMHLKECPVENAYDMARAYMQHRPAPGAVMSAEKSYYTLILPDSGSRPNMYLRTTIDLLYRRSENTIVIRDYKTFSREPSDEVDLDLQARTYILAMQKLYPNAYVEFEYEYVRTACPGDVHLKTKNVLWTVPECYRTVSLNMSENDARILTEEVEWAFQDIWDTRHSKRYYRNGLKGTGMYTCNSCFAEEICKKELEFGILSTDLLDMMSVKRESLLKDEMLYD